MVLGNTALPSALLLPESRRLGEPAHVHLGGAVADAHCVHHAVAVEEVVPDNGLEARVGAAARVHREHARAAARPPARSCPRSARQGPSSAAALGFWSRLVMTPASNVSSAAAAAATTRCRKLKPFSAPCPPLAALGAGGGVRRTELAAAAVARGVSRRLGK
jgi:hypothetical protein